VASGVLERHASVAGSSAGTARAPPAGLGPTPPARDRSTRCALRAPARAAPSAPPPPELPRRARKPIAAEPARAGRSSAGSRSPRAPCPSPTQPLSESVRRRARRARPRRRAPASPRSGCSGTRSPDSRRGRRSPRGAAPGWGQARASLRDDSKRLMSVAARSPIERLRLVAAPTRPPLPPRVPEVDRGQRSRSQGPGAPSQGRPRSRPSRRPPSLADPSPPA
jgi:hypothetical protein